VEPVAGLFGAVAVVIAEPLLPYTLAFAAGAMIYVVFDDIIPEAQTWSVIRHENIFLSTTLAGKVMRSILSICLFPLYFFNRLNIKVEIF